MSKMEDWKLIREYVDTGSEKAFAALVERHIGVVYSAALRRLGNSHTAEEITQSVFCLLAQKAHELSPKTVLVGWLYQTVCFITAKYWRTEYRRQHREQEAAIMSDTHSATDTAWDQLAPYVDEAMSQLPDDDRLAVLLRFFQQKPFSEVGRNLNISEDAARMRVNRALEKLRQILDAKKIVCTTGLLGALLLENTASAVPLAVMESVRIAALQATQVAATTSVLNTLLAQITATKLKIAAVVCLGLSIVLLVSHASKPTADLVVNTIAQTSLPDGKKNTKDGTTRPQVSPTQGATSASSSEPVAQQATTARELYELGQQLQKEGKNDEAMAAYTKSIDLLEQGIGRWDRFIEAYFRRASLYRETNDFEHSLADLTRLLEFEPYCHSARQNRAINYTLLGKIDEAINDYTFVINNPNSNPWYTPGTLDTSVASAYEHRGGIYEGRKEYEQAIADYSNTIRLNPLGGSGMCAYWRRGLSYRATQQLDKASADADTMSDTVLEMIAKIEERSPAARDAVQIADRACEILENPLPYHLEAKAAAYAKYGTFIPAIRFQEQAIEKSTNASSEHLAAMRARLEQYNSGNALPVEQSSGK